METVPARLFGYMETTVKGVTPVGGIGHTDAFGVIPIGGIIEQPPARLFGVIPIGTTRLCGVAEQPAVMRCGFIPQP